MCGISRLVKEAVPIGFQLYGLKSDLSNVDSKDDKKYQLIMRDKMQQYEENK